MSAVDKTVQSDAGVDATASHPSEIETRSLISASTTTAVGSYFIKMPEAVQAIPDDIADLGVVRIGGQAPLL